MKLYKIITIVCMLLLSIHGALATYENSTARFVVNSGADATPTGWFFNTSSNITNVNFTTIGNMSVYYRWALLNHSGTIIDSGNLTNVSGTYYIVLSKNLSYTNKNYSIYLNVTGPGRYFNTTSGSYPLKNGNVTWIIGAYGYTFSNVNAQHITGIEYFTYAIVPVQVLTITLQNIVNQSLVSGFCVNITSTNTTTPTQYLCNATGTTIYSNVTFASGNISFINITGGHAQPSYFNATNRSFVFGSSTNLVGYTSQALLSLQTYKLLLNTSINNFNGTNNKVLNTTTSGSLLLPGLNGSNNLLIAVLGNYSLNVSCPVTAPLSTVYCNATNIYDNLFTVGAKYGGASVSSFNVTITNTSLGGTLYYQNTTNGSIVFPLLQGYNYYFLLNNSNYSVSTQTLSANATTNLYNFTLYTTNAFNLTFYDEITNAIITENLTVELISDIYSTNTTAINGLMTVSFLTPADYDIRYRGANYQERDYYVTLSPQSYNTLSLYDINISQSTQVIVSVKDTSNTPVEGAKISLLRYYVGCNCYPIVEMSETSYTGESIFWVEAVDGHYKWTVEYNGVNYFISSTPEQISSTTRNFIIDLGSNYYVSYDVLANIGNNVSYNTATKTVSFIFNDPSLLTSAGCLKVESLRNGRFVSFAENCVIGSSGSTNILLTLPNETRYKYTSYINTSTAFSNHVLETGWIEENTLFAFQTIGIFLSIGIILTLGVIFSFSAILVIISSVVGIIAVSMLGIMPISGAFIVGFATIVLGISLYLMRS